MHGPEYLARTRRRCGNKHVPRHVPVFDGVIYLPVFHGAGVDVIHTSAKKNEVLRPPETVDGDEQAVSQRLATEARVGLHLRLLVGEGEFAPNKSKQKTWGCSG